MKHLAVYLLLRLGGNKYPTRDDIEKALGTVGIGVDEDKLEKLLASLQGKNLDEILKTGNEMLAEFGGGGGADSSNTTGALAADKDTNNKADDGKKKEADDDSVVSDVDKNFGTIDIFNVDEGDY